MDIYDIAGLAGCFGYLGSYILLQFGVIRAESITYTVLNLFASLFILLSVTKAFNLGVALLQISWIVLSVVGICRTLHNRLTRLDQIANRKQEAKKRQRQRLKQAHRSSYVQKNSTTGRQRQAA